MAFTPIRTAIRRRDLPSGVKTCIPTVPSVCCAREPISTKTTGPLDYVIKSGDTMVAIAKRFGFADWREIYKHPLNDKFRVKRPNPNVIYPGDVLVIPDQPLALGVPDPVILDDPSAKPWYLTEQDQNTSYVASKQIRLRLTLFWATNCTNMDASAAQVARAEEIFGKHNIALDLVPGRYVTPQHTINVATINDMDTVRALAAQRYDDQKTGDGRQRLPVIFCMFDLDGHGRTKLDSNVWKPYCLVRTTQIDDWATLAHEIVHATGHREHLTGAQWMTNLMTETTGKREEMFKAYVDWLAGSYFAT